MSTMFTQTFFDTVMAGGDVQGELESLIVYLTTNYPHLNVIFDSQSELTLIVETFKRIGKFFAVPFTVIERSSSTETVITYTFNEIFNNLKTMNVHQNVIHDGKNYECGFHKEELFDHLILSSLISCVRAIEMKLDPFIAALSAILHDIGKPGCIHFFSKGHIGYPYHGEFGAIILSRIYSTSFESYISKESWEMICRLLTVHMCSYHMTTFTSEWEQSRLNSTRVESTETKNYLMALSFGDVFAAISPLNSYSDFIDTRENYFAEISKPYQCNKDRTLITIDGLSNSGKSTVADMLMAWFAEKNLTVGYVARDCVMTDLVYTLQNKTPKNTRLTSEDYAECYAYYKSHGLGKVVNKNMSSKIRDSIVSNLITIVDTQMTMFKQQSQIIPTNVDRCLVISIDVSRNAQTRDDQKNGVSIGEQLKLSGISNFFAPFDVSSMDVYRLQSKYCSNTQDLTMIGVDHKFQICSNSEFDGANSIGLKTFQELFTQILTEINPTNSTTGLSIDSMTLIELVNYVYNTNGKDYTKLLEFFRTKAYQISTPPEFRDTPYAERIVHIKYLDHNNIWNTKWARDTRGTAFYLTDSGSWIPVKYLMQRGAEMLTGMQIGRGITDTENISLGSDSRCLHLSVEQQSLIIKLATSGNVDLKASFKKDGSLHAFTLYSGEFAKVLRMIIETKSDEFTNTVMRIWDDISGSTDNVFVFQSQGTMILGNFMQDYATTALFPTAEPELTQVQKVQQYGPELFRRLNAMFSSMEGEHNIIIAETICANRRESCSGKIHNELAVNYKESGFTILSRTSIIGDHYVVQPHYEFSDSIHSNGFTEPAYWDVTTVELMDNLIRGVDSYIFGKMTMDEFYSQYPPSNKFSYDKVIDVEGFVVYDLDNGNSYGKVKTDSYYKAHKLRDSNVPFLCELAQVAGHLFPLAFKVNSIYSSLPTKLAVINQKLIELVTSDLMINALNPKARASYVTKDKATQFKIVINIAKQVFTENAIPIFIEQFGEIQLTDDMKAAIVAYAMRCEIWRPIPLPPPTDFCSCLISAMVGH